MKYTKFNKNKNYSLNIMFVFEDALSAVNKMIDKSSVSDDIKFSIQNNVVNGKVSSNNMFASKLYDNNYFLVGLGNKNELTIQKYEKSRITCINTTN